MIDLDGLNLMGHNTGANEFAIRGDVPWPGLTPNYDFVEKRIGAVPLRDPSVSRIVIPLNVRIYGTDQDSLYESYGLLAQKRTKAEHYATRGGLEATYQLGDATYETTVVVLAIEIDDFPVNQATVSHSRVTVGMRLICEPYYFGDWYTAASGFKPTGMIAVDAEIADAKGDLPGQAKLELTNAGTLAQQFVNAGIQWRHADSDDTATLLPSTFDYSTSPLNGTYTAATNEVQRATPTGTISGGTFTLTFDGQTTSALAHNASTATVQAALEALSSVEVGDIVVSGSALSAGNMDFTFGGRLAGTNVAAISITSSLTGGGSVAMSTTTAGVAGYVANTSLQSEWSSFVRTAGQTDVGDYEIWALVQTSADANDCLVRATVSVGDASSGTTNLLAAVPASTVPIWVNLGPAHINARASGTHRWQMTIAAKTLGTAGTYCRVLAVQKKPTELGRILVKSPLSLDEGSLSMFDNFGVTSGALTGDTATTGQTWASMGGVSDADDFTETAAPDNAVIRTAVTDNSTDTRRGRGVVLGSATPTDVEVSVSVSASAWANDYANYGVIARLTDNDNFVAAQMLKRFVLVYTLVGGAVGVLGGADWAASANTTYKIAFRAHSTGFWRMTVDGVTVLSGYSAALATGGALQSGKSGIIDWHAAATAATRTYSNFSVLIPSPQDAGIHPSQDAAWQPNGAFEREASAGTYWAYAAGQQGAGVPRLGPAGDEGLINRLTIATADQNPDYAATGNQAAPFSWVLKHRPAYMFGRHEA